MQSILPEQWHGSVVALWPYSNGQILVLERQTAYRHKSGCTWKQGSPRKHIGVHLRSLSRSLELPTREHFLFLGICKTFHIRGNAFAINLTYKWRKASLPPPPPHTVATIPLYIASLKDKYYSNQN